jgi:hypothetical protein
MSQNVKNQHVDVDEMAKEDPEGAVKFIHGQMALAMDQINQAAQSQS